MQTPDGDILDGMYIEAIPGSQTFIQDILVQMYAAEISREDQEIVGQLIKDISRKDFENYLLDQRNVTKESFQNSFIEKLMISRFSIENYLLDKANISKEELNTYFKLVAIESDTGTIHEKLILRKDFYKRRIYLTEKKTRAIRCIPSQKALRLLEKIKGTPLL